MHSPYIPDSHFRRLFDLAPEPYLVLLPDERFTIVFANQARSRITMTEAEQVIGRGVFEAFPENPEEPEANGVNNLKGSLNSVLASAEPHTMATQRYDIKTPEGRFAERYWAPINIPVLSDEGTVLYIIHRVQDVTDIVVLTQSEQHERRRSQSLQAQKKELTDQLLELSQQLELANGELRLSAKRKDEFLATLAHELRNPLSAAYNAAHLMSSGSNPNNARLIDILRHQTNVLRQMVDDLLDLSRIDHGLINLQRGIVDVVEVAEHSVEAVRSLIYKHRHELKVTLPREPLHVAGDAIRIEQVVVNLLTNAAKYTEPGGCVELNLKRVDNEAQVWICDNGIGMEPEVLEHVFDLFGQADQGLARSEGGLGIGLNVVKKLVEKHHGSIRAESKGEGKGSKFCVSLPLVEAPPEHADSSEEPQPEAEGLDVLLVEDNFEIAETMRMLLQTLGHSVAIAHDGASAIETAQSQVPDVALLDIGLPVIDGYEVARQLKSNPATQNIFLAALSGYGQSDDVRRAFEAGISRHFTKPVDFAELATFLAELARELRPCTQL